ncbi:MAG: right-handed parallel beta-helix repeat-containing protein, partial [Planctomycetia bacterium]
MFAAATVRGEDSLAPADRLAISGDRREPEWADRYTVTVGATEGDLRGETERVVQAAVDMVAARGGGDVRVLPGVFRFRAPVHLRSGVRILGSGGGTVFRKEPSAVVPLAADADWYDQEITLADVPALAKIKLGDGVVLRATNPHNGGPTVLKRLLVARSGNRFKLDKPLGESLWLKGDPTCATLFPVLEGDHVEKIVLEDFTIDGNRGENDFFDGNYAGGVFMQDCRDVQMRRLDVHHYNGDGISWQICHDVTVEKVRSRDHAMLGLHPGSGSQRPIIRDNVVERTEIGVFFCWGVRHGVAERNKIVDVRKHGVSIGHRDVDNVVRDNDVVRSGVNGLLFRDETKAFAGHRNTIENNRFVDNGPVDGAAVDVQGETDGVALVGNSIKETRSANRIGVRIGPKATA